MSDENEVVEETVETVPKKPRGFGAMSVEKRRELGSRGGRTAHRNGTANRFTAETAAAAGKIPHERGTAYRWTPEEASRAGKIGGRKRNKKSEESP